MASVLAYDMANPYLITQLSFLLNYHVYNGFGDHNMSFTFKCLHLSVFFPVVRLTMRPCEKVLHNCNLISVIIY
jgi:hypothetical protein